MHKRIDFEITVKVDEGYQPDSYQKQILTAFQWANITDPPEGIPELKNTTPLYYLYPIKSGCYCISEPNQPERALNCVSSILKSLNVDCEAIIGEPLTKADKDLINQICGGSDLLSIRRTLSKEYPAEDLNGYTWKNICIALRQLATPAPQATNGVDTDPKHSHNDKEPQKVRKHNKPPKAESTRRNKKVSDCINEYTKYHGKITVAKISETTGLPANKIYNIPSYKAAVKKSLICKATDKNVIAGQLKPSEFVNTHTGQGQSHLRELTTETDFDKLVILEDNADFNGYE